MARKIFAVIGAMLMLFALTMTSGCGGGSGSGSSSGTSGGVSGSAN